ncbi:MAG: hypothetical protein [Bacteriophage sp.]|nr:MAG: hypothetical protein [Bacteriophage sp.]
MDKKYLKEHNLLESQQKFKQLCEYTFISTPLAEDDDDDDMDNSQNPQQGGNNQQMPPMDNNGSNMPPMNDMPPQNSQDQDMPQDDSMTGGEVPNGGELGDTLPDDLGSEDDTEVVDMEGDDEEVIDVDDLTNSQEETEHKVEDANMKIQQVMDKIDSFLGALKANDEKIADLTHEFQKRVPTETEKLNLRSQASYPYSIKPKDYWDDKATSSNYDVMYDNDVAPDKEEKEYTIKQSDISGGNAKSIADTFDVKDDMDLEKIFGV